MYEIENFLKNLHPRFTCGHVSFIFYDWPATEKAKFRVEFTYTKVSNTMSDTLTFKSIDDFLDWLNSDGKNYVRTSQTD